MTTNHDFTITSATQPEEPALLHSSIQHIHYKTLKTTQTTITPTTLQKAIPRK